MLDTVVLVLQAPSFTISNPNAFSPHIQTYPQFTSRGYVSCVQNPTAQDRQENVYKPCLTHTMRIVRGAIKTTLAVQYSIPKLLYFNNLDEVTDDALEQVIHILRAKLLDMGVEVHPTSLRLAPISVIHYSKNIILPPGMTPSMIMSQLAKLDIPLTFSIDHTRFKNAGHGINMYSKSFEVVFYDKIKDLQKGLKTPFDSDPMAYQQSLFDPQERAREASILRLEVRIKKKPKLERLLEICGQSRSITTEIYDTKQLELEKMKDETTQRISQLISADNEYFVTAHQILRLVTQTHRLFLSSNAEQKNRLLKMVLANCTIEDEIVRYIVQKPFIYLLPYTSINSGSAHSSVIERGSG